MHRTRILLCTVLLLAGACAGERDVHVEDAWVRAADSAGTTAAYFTLVGGARPAALTGIASDAAARSEAHETVREDGVARMRALSHLAIAPGARVAFEPGGRHVMLIGLLRALAPGDSVRMTLALESGSPVTFTAEVRP